MHMQAYLMFVQSKQIRQNYLEMIMKNQYYTNIRIGSLTGALLEQCYCLKRYNAIIIFLSA